MSVIIKLLLKSLNKLIIVFKKQVHSNREVQTGNAKKGCFHKLWDVLGVDSETIPDHLTLNEIGMESLLVIELQGELDRALGLKLTTFDIRSLSVGSLKEYEIKINSTNK